MELGKDAYVEMIEAFGVDKSFEMIPGLVDCKGSANLLDVLISFY